MSSTSDLLVDLNLSNIKCLNENLCSFLCKNLLCKKCPIMCKQQACKCQHDHSACQKVELITLVKNITQKKISTEEIQQDLQSIFDQAISFIFQTRKQILKNLHFLGLSRNQANFIQNLRNKQYYLLNSPQINQISEKLQISYFQKIESDLAKGLYTWHIQERYKFAFQNLKTVFEPYQELFNETQSILLQSDIEQNEFYQKQTQKCLKMMDQQQTKFVQKSEQVDELTQFLRLGYRVVPKNKDKTNAFRRSFGSF